MSQWKRHVLSGLAMASLAISQVAVMPRAAHAMGELDEGLYCSTVPTTIPSSPGIWETQRFWIDRFRFPGQAQGDPVLFSPSQMYYDTGVNSYAVFYEPSNNTETTVGGIIYTWVNGEAAYACIGSYPNGLWFMFSHFANGTAFPVYQDELPSGTGSTGGGGEGDDPFCIEYFNWWYDWQGNYHEEITGYECFGYET